MPIFLFFFFNDPATTEIYTLSLHDALPISAVHLDYGNLPDSLPQDVERTLALVIREAMTNIHRHADATEAGVRFTRTEDRKSTRLNSSHPSISYAVFCLKKKKKQTKHKLHT